VTKDGVLELELGERPTPGERSHEPDEHDVQGGSQGAGMLPPPWITRATRVLAPHTQVSMPT
jgi:hypothetical protein